MDVLLINPPVNRLCDVQFNYYPIGIGYIAALTNRAGYKTGIYNAEYSPCAFPAPTNKRRISNHSLFVKALEDDNHPVWQEFRSVINKFRPKIVGFSCTSASVMCCLKMAKEAQKLCGATIVFGGMHPTLLPEETARENGVDYVVVGEAEENFPQLVSAIIEGREVKNIPGVGNMVNGVFSLTPAMPLVQKLEKYPFPDRESLVFKPNQKYEFESIVSSRGCPYQCTFCSGRKLHEGKVRYRPVEDVIEEIKWLNSQYGVNKITFFDDSFILNRKRAVAFCEQLISQKFKIKWKVFSRADSVDTELLKLMKRSGCCRISMGVESGCDKTLAKIKKGYTRAQALAGIKMIKESGITAEMNIIIGFPFETAEDIKESISLIKEVNISTNINTFTPYPGSELFDECVRRNLLPDKLDWLHISQHSLYNAYFDEVSSEDYHKLLEEMITLADGIQPKKTVTGYINRVSELWDEDNHDLVKFLNSLSCLVQQKIKITVLNHMDSKKNKPLLSR